MLANASLKPSPADIARTTTAFQEFLRIRQSSPLFRLGTAAEVQSTLSFLNTGTNQISGLIVMRLSPRPTLEGTYRNIVVVFNATNTEQSYTAAELSGLQLKLHPI